MATKGPTKRDAGAPLGLEATLWQAADALRSGRDAGTFLAAFRRSLGPPLTASDSLPHWRGVP